MSTPDDVPQPGPELIDFYLQHENTGEPSEEALVRVQRRVSWLARQTAIEPAPRLRAPSRAWPWATAAALFLAIAAQGLYALQHSRTATAQQQVEPKRVVQAYAEGSLERALELAASPECVEPVCALLRKELAHAVELIKRLDTLTEAELAELERVDRSLGVGPETFIAHLIDSRRKSAPMEPFETSTPLETGAPDAVTLFEAAVKNKHDKNYERAIENLTKCVDVDPTYAACYRLLGSVYAAVAVRDNTASDLEKAREAYEQFLEVAPPEDEYVPKVRAILEAGGDAHVDTPRPALDGREITVLRGEVRDVFLQLDIQRVAVGDPSIVDLKVLGRGKLRLIGSGKGATTVLVWLTSGERKSLIVRVR